MALSETELRERLTPLTGCGFAVIETVNEDYFTLEYKTSTGWDHAHYPITDDLTAQRLLDLDLGLRRCYRLFKVRQNNQESTGESKVSPSDHRALQLRVLPEEIQTLKTDIIQIRQDIKDGYNKRLKEYIDARNKNFNIYLILITGVIVVGFYQLLDLRAEIIQREIEIKIVHGDLSPHENLLSVSKNMLKGKAPTQTKQASKTSP